MLMSVLTLPFSEFGDVKGQLVWIVPDALPPDHPFYRFPAKVRLSQQSLWLMVGKYHYSRECR